MAIKKGDTVKFLNETGGGIVTGLKNPRMANVLTEDGFEIPVLLSELILINSAEEPDFDTLPLDKSSTIEPAEVQNGDTDSNPGAAIDAGSEIEPEQVKDSDPMQTVDERNLLAGIVRDRSDDSVVVWLINDSGFNILYSVLQRDESLFFTIKSGKIDPDTKLAIKRFDREELNDFPGLRVHALFYKNGLFEPVAPSQADLLMDPVKLYSDVSYSPTDYFDENSFVLPLISDRHDKEIRKAREKELTNLLSETLRADRKENDSGVKKKPDNKSQEELEEVDLHIAELIDNPAGLSGGEVLEIQMARFTTALEGAIRGKIKRIVFIHGVGNGKLKYEIRRTLDKKYPRLKYQDASFKEYGYGATLVIVRK